MNKRYITVFATLIIALILVFFFQNRGVFFSSNETSLELGPIGKKSGLLRVGAMAPDFLLLDYENNQYKLSDHFGTPIVLNFWATWCPFCTDEMPGFQQTFEKANLNGLNLKMVGINRGEPVDRAKKFSDPMNLTYKLLINRSDDVAKAYNILGMPSTYLIDSSGIILEIVRGPLTMEQLESKIYEYFHLGEEVAVVSDLEIEPMSPDLPEETMQSSRTISVTGEKKHSVPLEDIRGGGPPKDGIPSIDKPKFTSIEEANKEINDDGVGIAVSFNGVDRFYPNQILVWHEIVNDNINGQAALVTYCPLCGTGVVFNPLVNGKVTEFGTSGKLWNSNLIMYDRQTDSYWSQVLGESIVGEMTGTRLELLPHQNLLYQDWKKDHPNGEVLSTDTGLSRNYNTSPYGDYDNNRSIFFEVDNEDDRFHPKAPTLQIEVNGVVKIYPIEELEKSSGSFTDKVGDKEVKIDFNQTNKTTVITNAQSGEEIVPLYGFWFSVIAVHPGAEVYTGG